MLVVDLHDHYLVLDDQGEGAAQRSYIIKTLRPWESGGLALLEAIVTWRGSNCLEIQFGDYVAHKW